MKTKVGFFEETPGVKSSTRLNSFILLLFFMAFNLMWANGDNAFTESLLLFDVFLLIGIFTPKFLHKLAENKINIKNL